ncbi:hypothetical protein SESBI_17460 [Sesbania bispinosa]|nr:hypothetical protein SESBI_17460 [Sesbania bispinosa]
MENQVANFIASRKPAAKLKDLMFSPPNQESTMSKIWPAEKYNFDIHMIRNQGSANSPNKGSKSSNL